jgi:predicted transposase YbfD/YdcC
MSLLAESFLTHFVSVIDPRQDTHNKRHLLCDILVLTILAVLCGAESWTDVELFGKSKKTWLKTFLLLPNGIPSHDTIGNLFIRLNPKAVQASFMSWMQSLVKVSKGQIIPIDGKTLRRSHDKGEGRGAIHIVSAWASANGVVLGQLKTEEKSNEITAIPELLGMLDIEGGIVTIDAMGCQKEIAEKIVDKKADYVLALKENHRILYKEVEEFFEKGREKSFEGVKHDYYETTEKGHGREEIRRYWQTENIEGLDPKKEWKKLCSIGMVESERRIGEKVSFEKRFYLSSLSMEAKEFARAVRMHWGIENQLHWSLDVTFREDDCRVRKGNAAENFAVIRHIALNLLKMEKTTKVGLQAKRNKAGWDNRYLTKILATAGF